MINIFKKQHGMNIVGQGGKIILFTLPSLVAAILVDTYLPRVAAFTGEYKFYQTRGIRMASSRYNPLGGRGYPINVGLFGG